MTTENKTKRIAEFRVTWEADHEQYWQGHGIAFTSYTDCATGCGETLREAFDDALEQLAEQDIDLSAYHVIHEKTGEDKMLSVEQEMLAELTAQVKEPEMLDWDIVKDCCEVQGVHKKTCPTCNGEGMEYEGTLEGWQRPCEDCEQGTVEDDDPDCAVCAGEWHYYVSIDVKLESEAL